MKNSLFTGIEFFFKGLSLCFAKGLRRYLIVPIVINIILLGSIFFVIAHYLNLYFATLIAHYPNWLIMILGWLFWLLFWMVSLLISSLIFSMLTNLIASPFYGLLAEEVAKRYTPIISFPDMTWWQLLPLTFMREIKKIIYFMPWLLFSLIVLLFPLTSPFSPIVWFIVLSWIFAVQYIDYEADNQRVSLQQMIKALKAYPMTALGFGSMVAFFMMIPGANLFVPPAAVAGGTALWLALQSQID